MHHGILVGSMILTLLPAVASARLVMTNNPEEATATIDGGPVLEGDFIMGHFFGMGEPPKDHVRLGPVRFVGDGWTATFPRYKWLIEECDGNVCLTPQIVRRGIADGLILRPEFTGPVFELGIGRNDPDWWPRPGDRPTTLFDISLAQPLIYTGWGGKTLAIESMNGKLRFYTPEPSTFALVAVAVSILAVRWRRRCAVATAGDTRAGAPRA